MNRYGRTVRHLGAGQVLSRISLRSRALAGRTWPGLATAFARRVAGPVPEIVRTPLVDRDLLRPCDDSVVRATAASIEAGRFEFLSEGRELGSQPFPSPRDAPLLWSYHLEYMDYLLDLCLSGREAEAGRLIRARWVTEGVPRPEATHPYPESRRVAAWLRAWPFLRAEDRGLAATGAWNWARRVARNRERDVGGNHLLENGLALAMAGAAFRGRRAAELARAGRAILVAGVREQVLPDGAHYEFSPMYHARVLSVFIEGALALSSAGRPVPPGYWEKLAGMAAFLAGVVDPCGELPLLGDTARERAFRPRRFLDAVGRILPVPVPSVRPGDTAWTDGGIYRFEDRPEGHRLLLDAGPVCPDRLPAHGQADTFGYELHVGGVPFVVDAGLHSYAAGPMRDWCRSTRAHSTVTVDGEDSSEVWASFRVGRRARVRDARWQTVDGRGSFEGRHDGYAHRGASHARRVEHLAPGLFVVADGLRGRAGQAFASRLHLHPEIVLSREEDSYVLRRAGQRLFVVPWGAQRSGTEPGWYCPEFGVRRKSSLLRFDASGPQAALGYVLSVGERPTVRESEGVVRISRRDGQWTRRTP